MKLLLRVGLVLAVVAGIGALVLWFLIGDKITGLKSNLDQTTKERDDTRAELATTKTDLANTKTELEKTTAELTTTKTELADTTKRANDLDGRVKTLTANLGTANKDLATARERIRDWEGLGRTVEQVKKTLADFGKLKEEREAILEEKKILERDNARMENQLAELLGDERKVEVPANIRGKIIQVDPKYEFVVLDVGGKAGVPERGELLINRNGKFIGKVKVLSVTPDQSVANIMRAFKQEEPVEGDLVLP